MLTGGKAVHGATLGILVLDSRFPRIPGDAGNALTWPFPVQYRLVPAASPEAAVLGDPLVLAQDFIREGRALVQAGCDGIATTCGFLVPLQDRLADALGVPVATSSLMQVPMVARMLPPGLRVGIITISAASLTQSHLDAARIPPGTPIRGVEGSGFARDILRNADALDIAAARADLVAAAQGLVADHPDLGAIVLECTNMVPYAPDVRRATGLPVFSIYTYLTWFQAALLPRRFADALDDPRLS
ncbi:MAG: aspartate/glutamate racemase family protein [Proteobacteria bacterium]|nr:aspartate/glutamate racemase family protein [Pseudomonadota bacterium]